MSRAIVFLVAAGLLLACDQSPVAVDDAESTGILASNGAVVVQGGECAVIDGTGAFFPVPCTNEVATYSPNGNAISVTHATGVPNPTGEVVTWGPENPGTDLATTWALYFGILEPPYPCLVLGPGGEFLFTLHWSAIVTSSGEATMTCHYSKKWEYQWEE